MYIRKRFTGVAENFTDKVNVTLFGSNTSYSVYKNQTDIVNRAIVETLNSVGFKVEYDEENRVIKNDKIHFNLLYNSQYSYNVYVFGSSLGSSNSNGAGGYNPFYPSTSTLNYDFYVTIKGDIENGFHIFIGSYTKPNYEGYCITIIRGNIVLENREEFFISFGLNSYNLQLSSLNLEDKYKKISFVPFGYGSTNPGLEYNPNLMDNGLNIPIINTFSTNGLIKFIGNFMTVNSVNSSNNFYNINGKLYYVLNNKMMVEVRR